MSVPGNPLRGYEVGEEPATASESSGPLRALSSHSQDHSSPGPGLHGPCWVSLLLEHLCHSQAARGAAAKKAISPRRSVNKYLPSPLTVPGENTNQTQQALDRPPQGCGEAPAVQGLAVC